MQDLDCFTLRPAPRWGKLCKTKALFILRKVKTRKAVQFPPAAYVPRGIYEMSCFPFWWLTALTDGDRLFEK